MTGLNRCHDGDLGFGVRCRSWPEVGCGHSWGLLVFHGWTRPRLGPMGRHWDCRGRFVISRSGCGIALPTWARGHVLCAMEVMRSVNWAIWFSVWFLSQSVRRQNL